MPVGSVKAFFRERWFLLLLVVGTGLAVWWPQTVRPWTARVRPEVMGLALFFITAGLDGKILLRALGRPLPALVAAGINLGIVPLLALAAAPLLPQADLRVGL